MYTLCEFDGTVTHNETGAVVLPCQSVDDPEFIAYNEWINAGNEPIIVDHSMMRIVPQSITALQLKLALNRLGIRDTLDAFLASNRDYQDIFESSPIIHRDSKFTTLFADAIGKTNADVDELFILADSIEI